MEEAQRAAKFLHDTWETLVATRPKGFHRKLRENKLTEKLHFYVNSLSQNEGRLTGFWVNENTDLDLDNPESEDPQVVNRIRKDITYKSNANKVRLDLIFEFKKLSSKGDSWKEYRGVNGMRRFVDGTYARGEPLAMMVGMLMDNRDICLEGLKRSLLTKGHLADLCMVPFADSKYLCEPSTAFPGVAQFDTEHNRPLKEAPSHGTMLLSHMFVSMPPDR